ncbi:hypothetical protein LMG27174_04179 [Paraburkholderia rhynchosiae]|uniref:Uncharacterized protein n=1 Tax=Paraburkholderia rhynchosiae TaxID=487049 RepID=A0A2N7WIU0_9BURK|nr:hypothetical protein C0Z16_19460 [Paraburkholderia rhynchosiae]CAB3709981.1 hypothetical protein LMG27174_04179 [Paraburkholderia rhynchosiae]
MRHHETPVIFPRGCATCPAGPRSQTTVRFRNLAAATLTVVFFSLASTAIAQTIAIVSGTYGDNCGVRHGNDTRHLAAECSGRMSCRYVIKNRLTDHPLPECKKNYRAEWKCGAQEFHTAAVSPEAKAGTLAISCVASHGAGK